MFLTSLKSVAVRLLAMGLVVAGTGLCAYSSEPGKEGLIFYHVTGNLATIEPNGRKPTELPGLAGQDLIHYQMHSARLALDGRRLAFGCAEIVGNAAHPPNKIHVRDVTKADPAELLVEMTGVELHNWTWSPDGNKLAFVSWDAENQIRNWVVDAKTKKIEEIKLPRVKREGLAEYQMSIKDWSPDGTWFLAHGDGLHLVKTDGSAPRRLTDSKLGSIMGGSARFSPDGKNVLFVIHHDDQSETLYVADVAGGKPRPVVEGKNFTAIHACWSPDSRRIAYTVSFLNPDGGRAGETNLNVIDADGRNSATILTEKHQPTEVRLVLTAWR